MHSVINIKFQCKSIIIHLIFDSQARIFFTKLPLFQLLEDFYLDMIRGLFQVYNDLFSSPISCLIFELGALLILTGDYYFSDSQQELIVSMALIGTSNYEVIKLNFSFYFLGAIVGSAVAGFTGDKFGRKPIVCVAAVAFIVGSILMAAAK